MPFKVSFYFVEFVQEELYEYMPFGTSYISNKYINIIISRTLQPPNHEFRIVL